MVLLMNVNFVYGFEVMNLKAKEQIKIINKYGKRKDPIPAPKIEENKKKYNRKKVKKIKKEELE